MGLFGFTKIALGIFLLNACQTNSSNNNAKQQYPNINLENRTAFELPKELEEISGHTFVQGNDDIVFCIQDELGEVFAYDLKSKKIVYTIKFASAGDYEGITNDGHNFYVLKSNGDIYSFPISNKASTVEAKIFKNLLGKGEYESLSIDLVSKKLVVFCKSCKGDRKEKQTTGYLLNYSDNGDVSIGQIVSLDLTKLMKIDSGFPKIFNPSAIAQKTSTKEWYFLSSIDKVIVITDASFEPKRILSFSRKAYEQPEGIAFDSKENLYISSEAGEERFGMLYKINQ